MYGINCYLVQIDLTVKDVIGRMNLVNDSK